MKCFKFKFLLILLFMFASLLLCSSNCFSFFASLDQQEYSKWIQKINSDGTGIDINIKPNSAIKIKLTLNPDDIKNGISTDIGITSSTELVIPPRKITILGLGEETEDTSSKASFFLKAEGNSTYLYIIPYYASVYNAYYTYKFYYKSQLIRVTMQIGLTSYHDSTSCFFSEAERTAQRYAIDSTGKIYYWWVKGDKALIELKTYCEDELCPIHAFSVIEDTTNNKKISLEPSPKYFDFKAFNRSFYYCGSSKDNYKINYLLLSTSNFNDWEKIEKPYLRIALYEDYSQTNEEIKKIHFGSIIAPNTGAYTPPSFSKTTYSTTFTSFPLGKTQNDDVGIIPLFKVDYDYTFDSTGTGETTVSKRNPYIYNIITKESHEPNNIFISKDIDSTYYYIDGSLVQKKSLDMNGNEQIDKLVTGDLSNETFSTISIKGGFGQNFLKVETSNMKPGTYKIEINYYLVIKEEETELETVVGIEKKDKILYVPLTINIQIKDKETITYNEQEEDLELLTGNGDTVKPSNREDDVENSILYNTNISAGTNGDIKEYTDNVSNLITNIKNDKFVIDTNIGTNSKNLIEKILSYIVYIGILVSIVCIAILGFRYIMGSVADKAEYKETLVTFAIGSAILVGGISIVKFILSIALNW